MAKFLFTKGHIVTKETSEKISKALLGKKLSVEHIKNVSEGHKKFFQSKKGKELRKLKSKKMKGHSPWNKGKKNVYSMAVLNSMSKNRKGKKQSKETIEKRKKHLPRGEKHHFWQGGKMLGYSENVRLRKSLEYKLWRRSIFERDDYTCVWCKQRGGKLEADHIKRFSDYPELRFAINNGRTLCKDCHKKTDTYGFKRKSYGMEKN